MLQRENEKIAGESGFRERAEGYVQLKMKEKVEIIEQTSWLQENLAAKDKKATLRAAKWFRGGDCHLIGGRAWEIRQHSQPTVQPLRSLLQMVRWT